MALPSGARHDRVERFTAKRIDSLRDAAKCAEPSDVEMIRRRCDRSP